MKLEWSRYALADRDEIFDYIEADSPRAAAALDNLIAEQTQLLIDFPQLGRTGRVAGTRELVLGQTPYIAAYQALDGVVRILRVLHGARQWPDSMPG